MQQTKAKGLSAFALKLVALAAMTLDHVAYFIPGAPVFLRVIGRIAAPIFFFLCAETMRHTRSREKYLLRLYIFSVVMELGKLALSALLGAEPYSLNIFATLFYGALAIYVFATFLDVRNEKLPRRWLFAALGALVFYVLWIIFYERAAQWVVGLAGPGAGGYILAVLPQSPLGVEGGLLWVCVALFFYLLPGKGGAGLLMVFLSGGLLGGIMTTEGTSLHTLFAVNYQWLMILALPFLLLYNGQRGRSFKWLFYVYYPLHVWLLYIIGVLLAR